MRLIVLGSGAGGGIPQWNANNPISRGAFRGDPNTPRRTQASIAVTADNAHWVIVNASPDLRAQIIAIHALHPTGTQLRSSPISSVVLTGADIDQIAGLLSLRERQEFSLYATERVFDVLDDNTVFRVLAEDLVEQYPIEFDEEYEVAPGLLMKALSLPGKPPLYLEDVTPPTAQSDPENSIAVLLRDQNTGSSCLYAPSCARVTEDLLAEAEEADVLLFDGTFFTDDEMIVSGEGKKTAQRMGHVAVSGESGSLAAFAELDGPRKIFIHINNTNPMAARDSAEAATVAAEDWEIAEDGMEIEL
jgi:pyrroloquinoline quinone biosynthesis protein B